MHASVHPYITNPVHAVHAVQALSCILCALHTYHTLHALHALKIAYIIYVYIYQCIHNHYIHHCTITYIITYIVTYIITLHYINFYIMLHCIALRKHMLYNVNQCYIIYIVYKISRRHDVTPELTMQNFQIKKIYIYSSIQPFLLPGDSAWKAQH